MATREQLIQALRNADAAGDRPAAEKLAVALQRMNTPTPPSPPEPLMDGTGGDGTQLTPEQLHAQEVMSQYEAQPWYSKAGTALDDTLRMGSNGITFGFRDKLAQFLGGGTPDEERAKTADAATRSGLAGGVAEAGGMMMLPGLGLEAAASKAVPASSGILKKLLTYGSGAAGEGAVVGGLDAAGHDRNIVEGAQTGALLGPLARLGVEGVSRGGSQIAKAFNPNIPIPGQGDLTAVADTAYRNMRREKINVRPHVAQRLATKNTSDMRRFELDDIVHPKASQRTKRLDAKLSRPTGISLNRLDAQRSAINRDIPGETAGGQTAGILRGNIDDFINRMGSSDTTGGRDPAAAIEFLKQGRDFVGRSAKMGDVTGALDAAERAAARGKTSDLDAAIRAKTEPLVAKGPEGYTPDEFAQLSELSAGTGPRKIMQQLGRLSPTNWSGMGGVGIGGGVGTGLMMGSPTLAGVLGVGIPAAGYAGKKMADRLSREGGENLKRTIAAGGNAVKPYTNAVEDALALGKPTAKRMAQMWAIANSNVSR